MNNVFWPHGLSYLLWPDRIKVGFAVSDKLRNSWWDIWNARVTLLIVPTCAQSPSSSCQHGWQQALAEQAPVGFRSQWPLKMWPWVLPQMSGESWTSNRSPCTGRWCWRTTGTCSQWVRMASVSIKICALQPQYGAFEVCVCFGSVCRDPSSRVKALEPEGKGNFTYNFWNFT